MNIVWDRGEATVADVWKVLSDRRKVARNTVLTLLSRLEEKGWLECDTDPHAHRYRASVPREATLGTMVEQLVESAFGGSAESLVMALLHSRKITKEETSRLRALIDQEEARFEDRSNRRAKK
jgi:predicted transcriptional regulator